MSTTIQWIFISNTFLLLAKNSRKRFYKFMFNFMERLHSQTSVPTFVTLHAGMLPYFTSFKSKYIVSKTKLGDRIGDTEAQKLEFRNLYKVKMKDWHIRIMGFYGPDTVEYLKIFPQGLSPLSQGSMDQRLLYFEAIVEKTKDYSSLDTIRGEMEEYLVVIQALRETSEHSDTNVDVTSTELKAAATALAVEMYGALGVLMTYYKQTPERILDLINVTLLRYARKHDEEPDNVFELELAAEETKEAGFVFTLDEKLVVYNSGNTVIRGWFVPLPTDPMPVTYLDVQPDGVVEFVISQYANVGDRFMMVKNLSTDTEGSVEIEKV